MSSPSVWHPFLVVLHTCPCEGDVGTPLASSVQYLHIHNILLSFIHAKNIFGLPLEINKINKN
jgi:hypothetical protein